MRILNILFLLVSSCLVDSTFASISCGTCPKVPIIKDFNLKKFAGLWYEVERFPSWFETGFSCVKSDYKQIDDSSFLVKHTAYKASSDQTVSVEVTSNVTDPTKPNRLVKNYPIKVFDYQVCTSQGVVYVWDTDYNDYSLLYSCKPLIPGFLKIERAWIYSRKPTLDAEATYKLKNELKQKGVDVSKFFVVNQHC